MFRESVFDSMACAFSREEILQSVQISWDSEIWNILKRFDG